MKAARFHRRGFGSVPPSLLTAAVVMALAVFAGCRSEAPAPTDRPVEPPGTASAQKIVLAVHPYASPVELVRQFTPLLEYLHEQIGQPFVLSVSKDYETHIQLVGGNQADIALMGPASYVAMSEAYGAKRLVCSFEVEGSPRFRGYVIVRKDNPATSVKDLAGNPIDFQAVVGVVDFLAIPFSLDTRKDSLNRPFYADNLAISIVRRFASVDEDEQPCRDDADA